MDAKQVANIILRQLGGNKFIAMTGANTFVYGTDEQGNPYLSMQLKRNVSKAKYLIITLNPMDTYNMKFISINSKHELKTVAEHSDVYNDMLQDIFTEVTGMYTHL